ncbi:MULTISPECIES: hypothetical protein [unclassified Streptomyces]|uniref:hypothetical protein n=1 Tax=unclassified Streptomyces TaxID=2593676 RepID=UPI002E31E3B6|nr:hypothetical protein [Streptomyces sp. NBC_01278]
MATPRRIVRIARVVAAGALSTVLLTAGGLATATTSTAAARPAPAPTASASAAAGSITLKATPAEVKAGDKWTTLHANTLIKQGSSFSFDNTFKTKGKEELRASAGDWTSPSTIVIVR